VDAPYRHLLLALTAVAVLATHSDSNGKVGMVGSCWGGGQVNPLAVNEPSLGSSVVYYGRWDQGFS
jgi:carboxymethylenebutenolidase